MENNEVWKDIKGFEGLYQVSNLGRVKSFKQGKERILKPGSCRGYKKWKSTMDVERNLGYDHSLISKCCNEKCKSEYGFVW